MATYSWVSASSGSWNTPTNWNPAGGPQSVNSALGPLSTDTAVFATGSNKSYEVSGKGIAQTVDVSGDRVVFQSFAFNNSPSGATFTIEHNASVTIGAGSAVNFVNHDGFGGGPLSVDDATLTVNGGLSVFGGSVTSGGHVVVSGPQAGFGFSLTGGVTFDATSSLSVVNGAHFGDRGDRVAGKVTVSGPGSHADLSFGAAGFGGIGHAAQGGTLTLNELDGRVDLAGGTLDVSVVAAGAAVSGDGTIRGDFSNAGAVVAKGGKLTLEGAATGPGTLVIGDRATLALDATTAEKVTFSGHDARLQLAPNIAATGFLGGFRVGDSIEIGGAEITKVDLSASGPDTVLRAFADTTLIDSFTIGGHIPQGAIGLSADSSGGTVLTYDAIKGMHSAMHGVIGGHAG
jgi:hypothetical protein